MGVCFSVLYVFSFQLYLVEVKSMSILICLSTSFPFPGMGQQFKISNTDSGDLITTMQSVYKLKESVNTVVSGPISPTARSASLCLTWLLCSGTPLGPSLLFFRRSSTFTLPSTLPPSLLTKVTESAMLSLCFRWVQMGSVQSDVCDIIFCQYYLYILTRIKE